MIFTILQAARIHHESKLSSAATFRVKHTGEEELLMNPLINSDSEEMAP